MPVRMRCVGDANLQEVIGVRTTHTVPGGQLSTPARFDPQRLVDWIGQIKMDWSGFDWSAMGWSFVYFLCPCHPWGGQVALATYHSMHVNTPEQCLYTTGTINNNRNNKTTTTSTTSQQLLRTLNTKRRKNRSLLGPSSIPFTSVAPV